MTLIFTSVSSKLIVMTADRIATNTKSGYGVGNKVHQFKNIACVATWGDRTGYNLFCQKMLGLESKVSTIEALKEALYDWLKNDYAPHSYPGHEDVGYHIAGFDNLNKPHIYHIFWGKPRPNPEHLPIDYYCKPHHEELSGNDDEVFMLFNGRNELVYDLVTKFIEQLQGEIKHAAPPHFSLYKCRDRLLFGDLVVRYAAMLTPEVGLPFDMYIMEPGIETKRISSEGENLYSFDSPKTVEHIETECEVIHPMVFGTQTGTLNMSSEEYSPMPDSSKSPNRPEDTKGTKSLLPGKPSR